MQPAFCKIAGTMTGALRADIDKILKTNIL
jgi:hypothetical protein